MKKPFDDTIDRICVNFVSNCFITVKDQNKTLKVTR